MLLCLCPQAMKEVFRTTETKNESDLEFKGLSPDIADELAMVYCSSKPLNLRGYNQNDWKMWLVYMPRESLHDKIFDDWFN